MKTLKITKTLGTLIGLTLIALSTGCGKAPTLPTLATSEETPEDTSVPTTVAQATEAPVTEAPTASNPLTVLKFNYFAITVCDALKNWNPQTTEIRVDQSPPSTDIYGHPVVSPNYFEFTVSGVKLLKTADGSTANAHPNAVLTKTTVGPHTVCKITVSSGVLVSVQ